MSFCDSSKKDFKRNQIKPLCNYFPGQHTCGRLTTSNQWHQLVPVTKTIIVSVLSNHWEVKRNTVYYKGWVADVKRLLFCFCIVEEIIPITSFMHILLICKYKRHVSMVTPSSIQRREEKGYTDDTWHPKYTVGRPSNSVVEVVFKGKQPFGSTSWNNVTNSTLVIINIQSERCKFTQ